ncbi:MAG: anaerobic glycerol-3-phosphate dehydrogenase subunit C [Anaerolineae bacterium]|nr:anaerobic glycerol-3-phosphate dehydrogenase subunit C [Anaerolineae bacterium]
MIIPELSLDQCIKCNICVTACPVAAVTDHFPGPKYVGPQANRFRRPDQPSPDMSVDLCSGCRICNLVCPHGVKIVQMNARARHEMISRGNYSSRIRLRNNIIARTELLGNLAQPIAPIANAMLSSPIFRKLSEIALDIAKDAPLPPFSNQRFSHWWKNYNRTQEKNPPKRRKVVFFHGCATEYYEPRIGRAAIHVLQVNGFEVIIPPQNCCGLPLLSNGEFNAAEKYHRRNVDHLIAFARQGIPIVGTSTSCTLTLKDEAPDLLRMLDEDTRLVAEHTYDLSEFLRVLWNQNKLKKNSLTPIPLKLAYHQPCQYRAHRIGAPSVDILSIIPQLEIKESHADCCGIAGTYGYKKEKYEIAMAVGSELFDFILDMNGPLAVCDSETCRWQITHATGVPSVHPVELLAAAYGFQPEGKLAEVLANTS